MYLLGADDFAEEDVPEDAFVVYQVLVSWLPYPPLRHPLRSTSSEGQCSCSPAVRSGHEGVHTLARHIRELCAVVTLPAHTAVRASAGPPWRPRRAAG